MKRVDYISALTKACMSNGDNISVNDCWVNDSNDFDGEDIQVESLEFNGADFVVNLANGDMFSLDELTDLEIERLYEDIIGD